MGLLRDRCVIRHGRKRVWKVLQNWQLLSIAQFIAALRRQPGHPHAHWLPSFPFSTVTCTKFRCFKVPRFHLSSFLSFVFLKLDMALDCQFLYWDWKGCLNNYLLMTFAHLPPGRPDRSERSMARVWKAVARAQMLQATNTIAFILLLRELSIDNIKWIASIDHNSTKLWQFMQEAT